MSFIPNESEFFLFIENFMQVSNVFLSNSPPNTPPLTSVISLAPTLPNYIFLTLRVQSVLLVNGLTPMLVLAALKKF